MFLSIISYFIGSIPTGVILAKYFGDVDLRNVGSGNIGATNVTRAMGKKFGAITLVGDVIKGVVPTVMAIFLLDSDYWTALVGLSAFLGHVYSIFLEFKGGKGVATALGVFLVTSPLATGIGLLAFIIVFAVSRYVSAASVVAAAVIPIAVYLTMKPFPFLLLASLISILVIFRHLENIKRLLDGTEKKFGSKDQ
ncbi:MAG: glycerol-3-phosphate 1-O-acyltransferase PlsY [Deltaproteobacteria bacterium]|nr:glycerol-3-phosphate 1-O-acyltransferase PlsY [Deltaproteobacteria bacterium]